MTKLHSEHADTSGMKLVGSLGNTVGNFPTRYYAKPEDFEEALIELKKQQESVKRRQDAYYSQPWV